MAGVGHDHELRFGPVADLVDVAKELVIAPEETAIHEVVRLDAGEGIGKSGKMWLAPSW